MTCHIKSHLQLSIMLQLAGVVGVSGGELNTGDAGVYTGDPAVAADSANCVGCITPAADKVVNGVPAKIGAPIFTGIKC